MMRDTIMTFTHERFGSIRSVRLRTDCYVVEEGLAGRKDPAAAAE